MPRQRSTTRRGPALSDTPDPTPIDPRIVAFFGQAWSLLAASQLRYWARVGETWAQVVPEVLQGAAASADPARAAEQRAAVVDTLRTGVAAMVELQVAEARRIEAELLELARRTWPDAAPREGDGYRRRWKAKT